MVWCLQEIEIMNKIVIISEQMIMELKYLKKSFCIDNITKNSIFLKTFKYHILFHCKYFIMIFV